ncbi:MAG: hypothetical protein VST72_00215 [Nitrospirota bacterium]|nr:hypothetical protein [Nitrospirota bacterium]
MDQGKLCGADAGTRLNYPCDSHGNHVVISVIPEACNRTAMTNLQYRLTAINHGTEPEATCDIIRMEKELFQIWGRIFIINTKDGIAGNPEKVLSCYSRR